MRAALQIAYDGYGFFGYARQPGLRTVEEELRTILLSHNITIKQFRSASRTDKHVSALCNVVAFNTNISEEELSSIHQYSTKDVIIYGYAIVDDSFFPRYASFRQYRYFLPKNIINFELLLDALCVFIGEHNFRNFARIEPRKNPIRTIDNIVVGTDEVCLWIDFYAQTFLWHQIRRIISALIKIAKRKISKAEIQHALDHTEILVDFGLAPAEPLVLKDIFYERIHFKTIASKKRSLSGIENRIKTRSITLFS